MDNNFILKYSKLIYSLTHYFEFYNNKEDLYQAGCVGLIQAYQNFDESYGVKFSTYAYSYILGEMKKLVRLDKGIKVSKSLYQLNSKIDKVRSVLSQKLMRDPTMDEIANFLDVDVSLVNEAVLVSNSLLCLDKPIEMDESSVLLADVISSNEMDFNTRLALKEELSNLSFEEKELVLKRFIESKTQSEVASSIGVSQGKISRMENKIKEKIKTRLVA